MIKSKIGFVLSSRLDNPMPSTRIAIINMLPFLHSADFQTCTLFEPTEPTETPNLSGVFERVVEENCGIVIFQKVTGSSAVNLARQLSDIGVRTVFAVCDRIDLQMASSADLTIVVSDFLRSLYPQQLQSRIFVVHDGIENPNLEKINWGSHKSELKALLVTSHGLDCLPEIESIPKWLNVRIVGQYRLGINRFKDMYWNFKRKSIEDRVRYLKFLMDPHISCVPWHAQGVYRELLSADIGIIPISLPSSNSLNELPPECLRKSENRLTLKMSIGLPVIATPIPSYESIIEQGRNGYLARTPQDWSLYFNILRDPLHRKELGLAARASVEKKYSMSAQASKLIDVLNMLN